MRKQGIVMFDLDDTLVYKESIFVDAQLTLLQTLSAEDPRLSSNEKNFDTLREIDIELVKLNKGVHWYESWKLAQALWLHLHEEKNNRKCNVCGKEISEQDSEDYEGMCWECWDDQLTEESDSMFDELM